MAKISGPLLDRIDIQLEVPSVSYRELSSERAGTSSTDMRDAVGQARLVQSQRFGSGRVRHNAQMTSRQIRQYCPLDKDGESLLKAAMTDLALSARAHDKVLRVARTIADLDQSSEIRAPHLSEAINYRLLDRNLWK
jgi:magnesium chelatase family protein